MAMEAVGFGLAIVSELQKNFQSLKERVACYQQGPELFQKVDSALTRVTTFADNISAILKDNPNALPIETLELFVKTQGAIKESLYRADRTYASFAAVDFTGDKSDDVGQSVKRKVKGFMYAKSLDRVMKDLEKELIPIEAMLQSQLTQLTTTLKTEKMEGNVLNKMEEIESNLSFQIRSRDLHAAGEASASTVESYRLGSYVLPMLHNLHLEFDARDEDGRFSAPEGELRSALLSSASSRPIIAARGAAGSATVHGASGMAGVGKTTALIALGHDDAVRKHFSDGVLYMSLGADASVEQIARSLSKIMKFTGARASAAAVRNQTDLSEAVEDAAIWFGGRRNLFLSDDVWPAKNCAEGYFPELRNILGGSPDSRIALTTRSRQIGSLLGSHVDFGARSPRGPISISIFMLHAKTGSRPSEQVEKISAVQEILNLCAGLPIALAVTVRYIASRVSSGFDFEYACDTFLEDLKEKAYPGSSFLDAAIKLSLEYLDAELKKQWKSFASPPKYSMYEMFSSLCVLEKQQWMRVSVLSRMWGVDDMSAERIALLFSSMSLGKTAVHKTDAGENEVWLHIHDLHLDFCVEQVQTAREWHFRLLQGHMSSLSPSETK